MPAITLKAHFDGNSIRLDEPFTLAANTQLLVTVLPEGSELDFRKAWAELGARELAKVYGDNEPEYSAADLLP
jgi:hypothetical protein